MKDTISKIFLFVAPLAFINILVATVTIISSNLNRPQHLLEPSHEFYYIRKAFSFFDVVGNIFVLVIIFVSLVMILWWFQLFLTKKLFTSLTPIPGATNTPPKLLTSEAKSYIRQAFWILVIPVLLFSTIYLLSSLGF